MCHGPEILRRSFCWKENNRRNMSSVWPRIKSQAVSLGWRLNLTTERAERTDAVFVIMKPKSANQEPSPGIWDTEHPPWIMHCLSLLPDTYLSLWTESRHLNPTPPLPHLHPTTPTTYLVCTHLHLTLSYFFVIMWPISGSLNLWIHQSVSTAWFLGAYVRKKTC